jgi:hypothetical protein
MSEAKSGVCSISHRTPHLASLMRATFPASSPHVVKGSRGPDLWPKNWIPASAVHERMLCIVGGLSRPHPEEHRDSDASTQVGYSRLAQITFRSRVNPRSVDEAAHPSRRAQARPPQDEAESATTRTTSPHCRARWLRVRPRSPGSFRGTRALLPSSRKDSRPRT